MEQFNPCGILWPSTSDVMVALEMRKSSRSLYWQTLTTVCTISTDPGSHGLNRPRSYLCRVRIAAKNTFSWVSTNHIEPAACVGPCSLQLTCIPNSRVKTKSITGVCREERETRARAATSAHIRQAHPPHMAPDVCVGM